MLPDRREDKWLDTAVSGIRFYVDRKRVRRELEGHLEDKMADLRRIFPDIPQEEARMWALSAMGDPEELKRSLARVHKPWLGWLWKASQWAVMVVLGVSFTVQMRVNADFNASIRGRYGTEVYHRITDGECAKLGQYTFRITGAAYVDRPEAEGARDSLQVVLRASSPKFWERIDPETVYSGLTAVGPDGRRYPMDQRDVCQYTIEDELGGQTTYWSVWTGASMCRWEPWYREFAVFLPAEGWEPGNPVTLELDSPSGRIELSVPVTERVRAT